MTQDEILEAVRASFGDLVDRVETGGTGVLVSRKEPPCAASISVTPADGDEVIRARIENFRDTFANGLKKLIAPRII